MLYYKPTLIFSWFVYIFVAGWCTICIITFQTGRKCCSSFGLQRSSHSSTSPQWLPQHSQDHHRCLYFVTPLYICAILPWFWSHQLAQIYMQIPEGGVGTNRCKTHEYRRVTLTAVYSSNSQHTVVSLSSYGMALLCYSCVVLLLFVYSHRLSS